MPFSPAEAVKESEDYFKKAIRFHIEDLQKKIDFKLKLYPSGTFITLMSMHDDYHTTEEMNEIIFETLADTYKNLGWHTEAGHNGPLGIITLLVELHEKKKRPWWKFFWDGKKFE